MAILLGNEIQRLATGVVIDAFSASANAVYTAPSTKDVIITAVVLRCTVAAGVSTPASAKVEINPAAGDIFAEESMIGLTTTTKTWTFVAEAGGQLLQSGNQLDVTITNAATGASQTLEADVFGYVLY